MAQPQPDRHRRPRGQRRRHRRHGEGAEIRYWVWKVDNEIGKQVAIRQAAAQVFDREAIAENAYDGTVDPLYSIVPPGFAGQKDAFQEKYGEPDADAAEQILEDAGIQTPVELTVGWTPTHYGPAPRTRPTSSSASSRTAACSTSTSRAPSGSSTRRSTRRAPTTSSSSAGSPTTRTPTPTCRRSSSTVASSRTATAARRPTSCSTSEQGEDRRAARERRSVELQGIVAEDVPFIPSWVGQNVGVCGPAWKASRTPSTRRSSSASGW